MSTAGVIVSPDDDWQGDTLAVDAAAIDTVLVLDNAGDFAEDAGTIPRYLMVGGEDTPRQYIAVDADDDQTVTLSAAVGGSGIEAGTPIYLWDPTVGAAGSQSADAVVWVRLHDGSGSVPVGVPHDLIPSAGAYALVGASVGLEEDEDGDWFVSSVDGRTPTVDLTYSVGPIYRAVMGVNLSVPNGSSWTTIQNWFALDSDRTLEIAGVIQVQETGLYRCGVGVSWDANTSGVRGLRVIKHDLVGGTGEHRPVQMSAAGAGEVAFETMQMVPMYAGEAVSFETRQTSGASLDLLGSNPLPPVYDPYRTDCYVLWDRPL